MVLHKASFESTAKRVSKNIVKLLNNREVEWTASQKKMHQLRIEKNLKKAKKTNQYTNRLLQQCKG